MVIEDAPDDEIRLSWRQDSYRAILHIDLQTYVTRISHYDEKVGAMTEFTA
jgi:hypothetical protein